ncbi:hypothetical protein [Flavobacterium bizetiae]|uniref:hypothetical protein n=1 Tax=Flavobacterium bizetiae TaxID=2704140 RepID=UPI00375657EF
MTIIKPSPSEIDESLKKWDNLENYVLQESSLKKLFTQTYPHNIDIDDVVIKVCCLNDFYSTNIFSPFSVAKHIVELRIDDKLEIDDLTIVNKIANVKMPGDKKRIFYSFASKYCSHHKPAIYPIYDSFADKMLCHFEKIDKFHNFKKYDLKDYETYRYIIQKFSDYYGLDNYDLKKIDKYLWLKGKEHFSKNYKLR